MLAKQIQLYFGFQTASWDAFAAGLRVMGYEKISFDSFDLMTELYTVLETIPTKILSIRDGLDKRGNEMSPPPNRTLIHLMEMYKSAGYADPRDQAYALLSLASPCCRNAVSVDYDQTVYGLWNTLMSHHLYWHCGMLTTVHNVRNNIRQHLNNGLFDTQIIKQAREIRDLLSATTPTRQITTLAAEGTSLFSTFSRGDSNDGLEPIQVIGTVF